MVDYTINNTLTGNDDYGPGDYLVVIPPGVIMVPFDIPVVDDNILEGNENFYIIIITGSLPNDVTRRNFGRARLTIIDDEGN